jgi:RNase P subunit RPR2
MAKRIKVGSKSKGICRTCKALQSTTARYRIWREWWTLVFVCNVCKGIVGIPHQSVVPKDEE